jgi:hypothetical protein
MPVVFTPNCIVDFVTPDVALIVIQGWVAAIVNGNGVAGVAMNTAVSAAGGAALTVARKESAVGAALIT